MRRHAKASSAGSTSGRGASLGSIRRGALATRASSFGLDGSGAPSHRGARLALALVLALTGLLALAAAPALAIPHVFATTFGSSGSGAGQLSHPQDVAVDQSTGDVYVADAGNLRVDKFDSAGNFILAFGKNVDQTTGGDVCTAASGHTCQAGTPGTGGGAFLFPAYVGVDNSGGPSSGDVYVGDTDTPGLTTPDNHDIVSKFTSAGVHINGSDNDGSADSSGRTFGGAGSGGGGGIGIQGMAVDPSGNLWVFAGFVIDEFNQSGQFLQALHPQFTASSDNFGIAVDASHVYEVNSGARLGRYDFTGLFQGLVTRGPDNTRRVALDPDTGEVYTNRGGGQVEHYNASCVPVRVSDPFPQGAGCSTSDVFGSGDLTNALGLAINGTTSTLYVADAGTDKIAVFVAPPSGPPAITAQWTSTVGSTGAAVNAAVNPMRNDTTCQLSYTDDATFGAQGYTGATTVACDPADLGSRFADHPVKVELNGLAPGTTYHYRFLAHSSAGDDIGADRTFSTEIPEVGLPDDRAYEQVSPANKDLGGIDTSQKYQAASDGNRMSFFTRNSLPGSTSDGRNFTSARGPADWSTVNQIPPQAQGGPFCILFAGISANSADLSQSVLEDGFNQSGGFFGCSKDDPELVPGEPAGVQNLFLRDNATGAYQLISHNPVTGPPASAHIAAADPSFSHVVFDEAAQLTADAPPGADNLYEWSGGSLQLVSIDPGGTPLASGARIAGGGGGYARHAVSDDGSRIFFQGNDGNLYARVNGTSTVQLDASQGSGPGGGGQFQVASVDGSKVFFTDDASAGLTNDTVPGSGANLYRYDFSTGNLTDLTPGADVRFAGLAGASDDGSSVYFAANGALAPGAAGGADCAPPGFGATGTCNLYVSHDGALTFIATLSSDSPNDCVWTAGSLCARASADGTHLAFNSDRSLTSIDTGGQREVYLYDQPTDQLVCASCPPGGTQPDASSLIANTPSFGGIDGTTTLTRNLSADGSRLFFTADGPLVGRDTDGRRDVYEYSGGKPHLISSGTAIKGAIFLDASASGDNVFFATEQKLTSSDIDDSLDIYDARVGGGFPENPPPPPCQNAEQCHPGGTSESNVPGAGSGAFNGPGNPQINRKAKKHHKKHHHKRRHHKRTAKHNRRAGK